MEGRRCCIHGRVGSQPAKSTFLLRVREQPQRQTQVGGMLPPRAPEWTPGRAQALEPVCLPKQTRKDSPLLKGLSHPSRHREAHTPAQPENRLPSTCHASGRAGEGSVWFLPGLQASGPAGRRPGLSPARRLALPQAEWQMGWGPVPTPSPGHMKSQFVDLTPMQRMRRPPGYNADGKRNEWARSQGHIDSFFKRGQSWPMCSVVRVSA